MVILLIAFALSVNRRAIRPRVVGAALVLQAGIAFLVLRTPWGRAAIGAMSHGVSNLLGYAKAGTDFIFGPIASPAIGGASFAIAALPVIIFFSSLISILYYLGVMQFVIRWVGGGIRKVTGITRVESLCAAANIFVGQSESPLVIKPYLAGLTPAQLFTVMTAGMAGVAGTILGAYASMIGTQLLPYLAGLTPAQLFTVMTAGMAGVAGTILGAYASMIGTQLLPYLLAASFMSAPGGIAMAKIIMPDDPAAPPGEPLLSLPEEEERPANLIMAASQGAQVGVKLAVAVGAMVLAFVALIALANGLLGGIGAMFGQPDLSFQQMIGLLFRPVMWLLGVPWDEAGVAGGLFGTKLVLNEFVGFIELARVQASLSPATVAVVTFSLCGFANFASIAVQMAVTGNLAPNQRPVIARLGIRALIAGSLANLMSAALAGLMLSL